VKICHCGSDKEFDQCCGPFLTGEELPSTAEALMRSRYSAYVIEDYAYVLRTCHASTRPEDDEFDDQASVEWTGLEIIETEAGGEGDDEGTVEFIARYQASGGGVLGMHEKGSFVREDGQWFYLDGDLVKAPPVRSAKVGRNEPCPCGSGKKNKKCCLKK
jgi:SEC-C motif-containing protein